VSIVDDCDAAGRDLVRLLIDLQALVRGALLDAIAKGGKSDALGSPMTTDKSRGCSTACAKARGA